MQRKQRHVFKNVILTVFFSCLILSSAQASKPLWTFIPQTPTDIIVAKGESAQVIYTVQNQSSRAKILMMKPLAGISQGIPCQLPPKGSCILTLSINGSALEGEVEGGPVLCQQGNSLQCYQPNSSNILRIRSATLPPVQQYTITPLAGANGSISPATAQVVNGGSSLVFTAIPDPGFGVNQWLLDGSVAQNGGTSFQLNNIQTNHRIEVTFGQATLSPLAQNLALSINSPGADPALTGNARIIRIENTGSIPANNVQVSTSGFPAGTNITNNTCEGTLNAGATCDITITPGGNASLDAANNVCTTAPGTEPTPTIVTVSANNVPATNVNLLILGYGCIYQGGFLFAVDDATANTQSIGGKVAALTNEPNPSYRWATLFDNTAANSITDGFANTNALSTPSGQYPAAQSCLNKNDQGFTDWFLPAICELGRFVGVGADAGCGTMNPNLYTTLYTNSLGGFANVFYWSSTELPSNPTDFAAVQNFGNGFQGGGLKNLNFQVRCVRALTP